MRLIDADDLAAKIMMEAPDFMDGGSSITKAFVLAMVKTRSATPTIDAVPVVRCKDCWYGEVKPDDNSYFFCTHPLHNLESHESHYFCADGEKRE
jgi:hypothetical protein